MNIIMLLKPKCDVSFLYDDNTLRQGLEKLRYHGYTAIPVITRDGSYAGTVTEGDFLWHMLKRDSFEIREQEDFFVRDILKKGWNPSVKITTTMEELLLKVMDQNFVPVTDDRDAFMGIVTRRDVLKHFYQLQSSSRRSRKLKNSRPSFLWEGRHHFFVQDANGTSSTVVSSMSSGPKAGSTGKRSIILAIYCWMSNTS